MKNQDIETFLKDVQPPAPDPEARLRAKRAALAEFARAADKAIELPSQESAAPARLSRESHSHGSTTMKKSVNRGWYALAAGLGVMAIGLSWVLPNLHRYSQELAVTPAPESKTEPTAEATSPPIEATLVEADGATLTGQAAPAANTAAPSAAAQRVYEAAPLAKQAPPPATLRPASQSAPAIEPTEDLEDAVILTGARAKLAAAREMKRESIAVVDSITTNDLGRFPDSAGASREEGNDKFAHFDTNPLHRVADAPVSTFSADVDTAAYSFVRARINEGQLPEKDAVRAEEMINYFDYAWPAAETQRQPFKPTVVVSDSPWNAGRKLVHIGIKGFELDRDRAPDANLVLLLDVSGSMDQPDKLPLVVRSMEMLVDHLKPSDTVGIVVYAGAAGTVLPPTPAREKARILAALRSLKAGGSTAGAAGIALAYRLAEENFRKGGVNRILLCTDGDFNVGINGTDALKSFVERKRAHGVYLSVLGFGEGNYRDELAQALAQNGNGVAAYIDTENEARKVLVQEASASLFTIAQDVKLQVEFNPATVSEYRLIGYETRALRREDFNNDAVDAGDIGAGHTVTAIYEITPVGAPPSVDALRYSDKQADKRADEQKEQSGPAASKSADEYGFLKIRYKLPGEKQSRLLAEPIRVRAPNPAADVKRDVQFSTAVAGFAQLLRGGTHTGALTYDDIIESAQAARGEDRFGYRSEFIELVRRARALQPE